ncbi:MAG: hypothetical protein SCALA702_05960 [Melioribacteraceae bacterium]|nr:MAG: hypothetical protein SCALA702_05960 [Melioribacteraceae bacterium]
MKKILSTISILGLLFLIGCDDSFDPKADFEQEYIVNGIIRCDTTYQVVYIQTNYNPDAFNPFEYNVNTFISGASVTITYDDSVYTLQESTFEIENNERLSGTAPCYVIDNLSPDVGKLLYLNIVLPDGTTLNAETLTPKYTRLRFDKNSDALIPASDGFLDIEWEITDGDKYRQVYLPEVKIAYYKIEGNDKIYNEKTIPLNYIDRRGELVPNYPLPNNRSHLSFEMGAIDKTMELISEGDPEKQNYVVLGAVFQILLLDNNLVPYYMSTETFLGGYSIILDQLDYSNINGGSGIFASYFTDRTFFIRMDNLYIKQFGYSVN